MSGAAGPVHARPISYRNHFAPCGARVSAVIGEHAATEPSSSGDPGHPDVTCVICMHVRTAQSEAHRARLKREIDLRQDRE